MTEIRQKKHKLDSFRFGRTRGEYQLEAPAREPLSAKLTRWRFVLVFSTIQVEYGAVQLICDHLRNLRLKMTGRSADTTSTLKSSMTDSHPARVAKACSMVVEIELLVVGSFSVCR